MNESQIRTVKARMASDADRQRHESFLRTTDVGDLKLEKSSSAPEPGEQWEVVAEWDVVPKLSGLGR